MPKGNLMINSDSRQCYHLSLSKKKNNKIVELNRLKTGSKVGNTMCFDLNLNIFEYVYGLMTSDGDD